MAKWHAQNPKNGYRPFCNRAGDLTVSAESFAGRCASDQCEGCRKALAKKAKSDAINAKIERILASRPVPVVTSTSISDDDWLV